MGLLARADVTCRRAIEINLLDRPLSLHYRRPRQRRDRSLWVEGAQWDNLAGSNSGALSTEVLKTLGTRRCLNI